MTSLSFTLSLKSVKFNASTKFRKIKDVSFRLARNTRSGENYRAPLFLPKRGKKVLRKILRNENIKRISLYKLAVKFTEVALYSEN